MSFSPVEEIRKKSREEWQELIAERITDTRIWVQEHGEVALIAGVVAGLFVSLFFKFFVGTVVVLGLLLGFAWSIALPDVEHQKLHSVDVPTNGTAASSNGAAKENSNSSADEPGISGE